MGGYSYLLIGGEQKELGKAQTTKEAEEFLKANNLDPKTVRILLIPDDLKKWERQPNYGGDDLSEYYVVIGRTRDSEALERANYTAVKKRYEKELAESGDNGPVIEAHFRHWACGWIDAILVHETADLALLKAIDIHNEIENYPVLDDDLFNEEERIDNTFYCDVCEKETYHEDGEKCEVCELKKELEQEKGQEKI